MIEVGGHSFQIFQEEHEHINLIQLCGSGCVFCIRDFDLCSATSIALPLSRWKVVTIPGLVDTDHGCQTERCTSERLFDNNHKTGPYLLCAYPQWILSAELDKVTLFCSLTNPVPCLVS